jgi:hypothetical protein
VRLWVSECVGAGEAGHQRNTPQNFCAIFFSPAPKAVSLRYKGPRSKWHVAHKEGVMLQKKINYLTELIGRREPGVQGETGGRRNVWKI